MTNLAQEYAALLKDYSETGKLLNKLEAELSFKRSALRKLVTVNKYSTFTKLEFNGRVLRVKYNSYGDETVTENGKKINLYHITRGSRQSINDLRLLLATGRI